MLETVGAVHIYIERLSNEIKEKSNKINNEKAMCFRKN